MEWNFVLRPSTTALGMELCFASIHHNSRLWDDDNTVSSQQSDLGATTLTATTATLRHHWDDENATSSP